MSDQLKLGVLIDEGANRDAIHIAVAPVVAAERLVPGAHIGFVKDGDTESVGLRCQTLIGIVDPFLTAIVEHGQRFYMFLYPQTVTGLRHEWTHPAFEAQAPKPSAKELSEAWLRDFARRIDVTYSQLMESAVIAQQRGYGHVLNFDTPDEVYSEKEEAWKHYEIVTGTPIADREATLFSCAC